MPTDQPDLPPKLRAAIARDFRAVTPLPRPAWRTLALVPIGVVLLFSAMLIFGLRRDAPQLGIRLTWIASTLQMLLGLAMMTAALREAVPGTTLSRRILGVIAPTVFLAVVVLTWMTWRASHTMVAPGAAFYVWSVCLAGTVGSALPALAIAGWLAARAFPLRPRLAGALYGLGAGLLADSGWRLFCHFSDPAHVFGAHTVGVLATAFLGVGLAVTLSPLRR